LVYSKLQPYKHLILANISFHKLVARYYGAFRILERVGKIAYKLVAPWTKIHDVLLDIQVWF